MRHWLLILTGLFLLIAVPFAAEAQERPTLNVTSPKSEASLKGNTVTVEFEVDGLKLVPSSVPLSEAGKRPEANKPGEGHLHIMLDLQPVVVWNKSEPYTFQNVPPGEHQLTVEVANNDHSPLSPPVVQQIQFRTLAPETMPDTGDDATLWFAGWQALLVMGTFLVMGGLVLRRRSTLSNNELSTTVRL